MREDERDHPHSGWQYGNQIAGVSHSDGERERQGVQDSGASCAPGPSSSSQHVYCSCVCGGHHTHKSKLEYLMLIRRLRRKKMALHLKIRRQRRRMKKMAQYLIRKQRRKQSLICPRLDETAGELDETVGELDLLEAGELISWSCCAEVQINQLSGGADRSAERRCS
ncbi:hypothetical protein ACQ4PT_043515 [Festuca glaucescens]